jgi:hypothetical protein
MRVSKLFQYIAVGLLILSIMIGIAIVNDRWSAQRADESSFQVVRMHRAYSSSEAAKDKELMSLSIDLDEISAEIDSVREKLKLDADLCSDAALVYQQRIVHLEDHVADFIRQLRNAEYRERAAITKRDICYDYFRDALKKNN